MRFPFFLAVLFCWVLLSLLAFSSPVSAHELEKIAEKIKLSEQEKEWLASHSKVRVRVGDWPPFMFSGKDASGISVDYLDLVSDLFGIEFVYLTEKELSWPETLQGIAGQSTVDLIPAIQSSPDRSGQMLFTAPYQRLPWAIVTRSEAVLINGLADLSGRRVSIQDNFILHSRLLRDYPEISLDVVDVRDNPTLDCLHRVASEQSFATVNILPVLVYLMRSHGLANLKVAAPARIPDMELSMAVRDDWPELVGIINKTLAALGPDGRTALMGPWMDVKYNVGVSTGRVIKWVLSIISLSLACMLLLYVWNRQLQRKVEVHTTALRRELAERKRMQRVMRASLREKEVLLREIHHRVKNNLQVISSLLQLGESSATGNPDTERRKTSKEVLRDSRSRIVSMALVHDELYRSDNLAVVEFTSYARRLGEKVSRAMRLESGRGGVGRVHVSGDEVRLAIDLAIPCGLILTELITNAFKHAFGEKERGMVRVDIRLVDLAPEQPGVEIRVADDGCGLPFGFRLDSVSTLGLTLVDGLVAQVRGRLEVREGGNSGIRDDCGNGGTEFMLRFPLPPSDEEQPNAD